MGIFAFKLPDIGEGVVEGEVVEWMVSVGDTVKEDDPILSVMTDKATVEIPSPTDGVVKSLVGEPGTILAVGQVCIEFETDGEGTPVEEAPVEEPDAPEPTPVEEKPESVSEPEPKAVATPAPAPTPVVVAAPGARPLASPAVRQRARESGIDLASVSGSGPAGRITHADLDSWKDAGSPVAAAGLSSISFSTNSYLKLKDDFYSSTIAENILLLSFYDNNFLTNNISTQSEIMMGNSYIWRRNININRSQNSLSISVEVASETESNPYKLEIFKTIK